MIPLGVRKFEKRGLKGRENLSRFHQYENPLGYNFERTVWYPAYHVKSAIELEIHFSSKMHMPNRPACAPRKYKSSKQKYLYL